MVWFQISRTKLLALRQLVHPASSAKESIVIIPGNVVRVGSMSLEQALIGCKRLTLARAVQNMIEGQTDDVTEADAKLRINSRPKSDRCPIYGTKIRTILECKALKGGRDLSFQ